MRDDEWVLFGAALDPLDAPEKVEMKLAYLRALGRGGVPRGHPRDPYDLLAPQLEEGAVGTAPVRRAGKVRTEDWLTPRPSPRSGTMLKPERFSAYIDGDGCREQALEVEVFVKSEAFPGRPLMLGVDHSQSAGVIRALAGRYGREELRVVVIDAHSDIISTASRHELYRALREAEGGRLSGESAAFPGGSAPDSFNCGSFLYHLLEEGDIRPDRLLIAGAADLPPSSSGEGGGGGAALPATEEFERLRARGVSFLAKRQLRERGMPALLECLKKLGRGPYYLSIDLDVGALDAVGACRFMDLFGLSERELLALSQSLAGWMREAGNRLAGLDVMEMDIHLAGLKRREGGRDRTARVAARMARALMAAG